MNICPSCDSEKIIKYGKIHNEKQRFKCKNCGRQFVENPENKIIPDSLKDIIDNLLLEKIPLAGIARAVKVSETWLQQYVNKKYEKTPKVVNVTHKPKGKMIIGLYLL